MWSGFGLNDLSKLGEQLGSQLGEALQKAKTELDRGIDKAYVDSKRQDTLSPSGGSGPVDEVHMPKDTQGLMAADDPVGTAHASGSSVNGAAVDPTSGGTKSGKVRVVRRVVKKAADKPLQAQDPPEDVPPRTVYKQDETSSSVLDNVASLSPTAPLDIQEEPEAIYPGEVTAGGSQGGGRTPRLLSVDSPIPDEGLVSRERENCEAHRAGGGDLIQNANGHASHPDGVPGTETGTTAAEAADGYSPAQPPGMAKGQTLEARAGLETLGPEELRRLVQELNIALHAREEQMSRQALQMSQLESSMNQLQEKNQQLVLKAAQVSEEDLEALRAEFEQRLGAAERKVYALTKERDAVKKSNEKLTEENATVKDKENTIKEILEEGEKLSKKQLELETLIKRLRAQLADSEEETEKLTQKLAAEQSMSESLRSAKAQLEVEYKEAVDQYKVQLDSQKERYEALLRQAKEEQDVSEARAREAAAENLGRRCREAESRCESMSETILELRDALERQRNEFDAREELIKQELSRLERRCQSSEARHQEVLANMPEATRPLLQQIEAMAASSEAQQVAWREVELSLMDRIAQAERRVSAATENERLAIERWQVIQSKLVGAEGALGQLRGEVSRLEAMLKGEKEIQQEMRSHIERMQQSETRVKSLEVELESTQRDLREEKRQRQAAQKEIKDLKNRLDVGLSRTQSFGALPKEAEPPVMAAPGYKWQLVREDQVEPESPGLRRREGLSEFHAQGSSDVPVSPVHGLGMGSRRTSIDNFSLGGERRGPSTMELEQLRALVRQKQGEVQALEHQRHELIATRDQLASELVAATTTSQRYQELLEEVEKMKGEKLDVEKRYLAAVELLGERDEQLEELRADLEDVKCMYREQVEMLLAQMHPAAQ